MAQLDFDISDHGTIYGIRPVSDAALEHAEIAFADSLECMGFYVVEPRYIGPVLNGLVNDGYACALDGRMIDSGAAH